MLKKKGDDLTSDQLTAIAIGQMGLGLDTFLNLTPFEFSEAYQSFIKDREYFERQDWEIARWQVFRTICPPDGQKIKITDLITFPWEEKTETRQKPSTRERYEYLKKKWHG